MFMKKGMVVLTTDEGLYHKLHGLTCNRQHEHQAIEGTTMTKTGPLLRTEYTARYPRKFARLVAKAMTANRGIQRRPNLPRDNQVHCAEDTALAGTHRIRKPASFARSEVISPEAKNETEIKRRRLSGKQGESQPLQMYQSTMTALSQQIPRVGKSEIMDSNLISQLQELFPDKYITRVLACRGTDRTMGPPENMDPLEAPSRKSFMIQRSTGDIKFEKDWEKWVHLSKRQLIRPSHACRINVTMFARDFATARSSEQASGSQDMPTVPQTDCAGQVPSADDATPEHDTTRDQTNPNQTLSQAASSPHIPEIQSHQQDLRFKGLPKWEQQQIINMHKNLGHPSNDRLSKALQVAGFRTEMVQAALGLKCAVCAACSPPKHQRAGTLKPLMDFNHKIYLDGVTWKNSQGKLFHFYHVLDGGTNYHVAMGSPSKDAKDLINLLNQHWVSWAGPPSEMQVDSGTELISQEFIDFTQRFNIKQSVIPPEAHWQQGKIERHGGFLQKMLTKIDLEMPIEDYPALQLALNQCTHAKNSMSIRHGYAPEVIVFGKHTRLVGSILSDDSIPAHEVANREDTDATTLEFQQMLKLRETARKAFHSVDNSTALRRAMLSRACPHRGQYMQGQWVMIWRAGQNASGGKWHGPQRVVIQDGSHTVWTTQGGKLFRSAPEHIRLALPEEGQGESCEMPSDLTELQHQINRMSQSPDESPNPSPNVEPHHNDFPTDTTTNLNNPLPIIQPEAEEAVSRNSSLNETLPQPDQEPDNSRQQTPTEPSEPAEAEPAPAASNSEELLICQDADWVLQAESLETDMAWRCEFDINFAAGERIPETQTESWIMLATNAKKQRTEVRLSELSREERQEFEKAKEAEVQNWIQTGTLTKVLRDQIPEEQILKCRWILTWKPLDNVGESPQTSSTTKGTPRTHKAKARLVVLGYMDPKIEEIPRDSPTLGRTSKMIALQVISSCGWKLTSFDIKAAFLQGQPQSNRIMGIEPVKELKAAMNMTDHEVGKLNKGAYGLIDAPFLWYCALVTELKQLGFEATPFDPCLFVLRVPEGEPSAGSLAGILGVHVDDGIGGGNEFYDKKIKLLEKKFPFGSHKTTAFTFTGIEVTQRGDMSIHMSQSSYVKKIPAIAIDPNRKTTPEEPINEKEKCALRGLVGSLQYAATNTRPDLSSKLSFLQSAINHATVETLMEGNRLLHEAKKHHDVAIVIKPIPLQDFRFMAFSDASFSSNKKPDSHAGVFIVGTHKEINDNKQCPISPIAWGCKKIQRVVTSTLAAESTSLASALDQLAWLRIFWSWLLDPRTNWRKPEDTLKSISPAISAPTFKETADIAITDCKSLYDLTTRTAPPSCSEFRVQLVSRAIKEALQEGILLRWVHSGAQLADALTKAMESHFLRATLKYGYYQLSDENAILKKRAKTKDRLKWLKESQTTKK